MELEWQAQQDALRHSVILEDEFGTSPPKYVGGVDISFSEHDVDVACTCLVVLSYPELQMVYSKCQLVLLDLPYIPGFLGFREVPSMIRLLDELKSSMPHLYPSVVLVDGNGILHPRQFGSACHLGVLSDTATIGVAKKIFDVDGLSKTRIHQLCENALPAAGSAVELRGNSDRVWGYALRSTDQSSTPIFISPGHRVSLATSLELVRHCCLWRVPEPIRQADLLSRAHLRSLRDGELEPPDWLLRLRERRSSGVVGHSVE